MNEPPPTARPDLKPVWPMVIDDFERWNQPTAPTSLTPALARVTTDMRERHRIGVERYGVPLTAHNGRRHLHDAYEELLDAAVYLRTEIDERGADWDACLRDGSLMILASLYRHTLDSVLRLAILILGEST